VVTADATAAALFRRVQQSFVWGLIDVAEHPRECVLTLDALNVHGLVIALPLVRARPRMHRVLRQLG
jgi:hypothetical protein